MICIGLSTPNGEPVDLFRRTDYRTSNPTFTQAMQVQNAAQPNANCSQFGCLVVFKAKTQNHSWCIFRLPTFESLAVLPHRRRDKMTIAAKLHHQGRLHNLSYYTSCLGIKEEICLPTDGASDECCRFQPSRSRFTLFIIVFAFFASAATVDLYHMLTLPTHCDLI
jgi:hypothetical protein